MTRTRPKDRTTDELLEFCFINIDKPAGPTSHDVTDTVKKLIGAKKAGHTGTLDPAVTGCLVIALNKATRLTEYFLRGAKEYEGEMHLHKSVEEKKLRETIKQFIGTITQLPPKKSAVKRQERERTIYSFEILGIKNQRNIEYRVSCQAGTYIRKLCHDVGEALGVGAHMSKLRRTRVADITDKNIVTIDQLKEALAEYEAGKDKKLRKMLIPPEKALTHLKQVHLMDSALKHIMHGMRPQNKDIEKIDYIEKGEIAAVYNNKCLVGIAELRKDPQTLKDTQAMSLKMVKVLL